MSRLILCMSMSLDGFVSGVDDKLTHRVDEGDEPPDGTTFHTDVAACAAAARAAAGDGTVMMHGASAAQAFLAAGELDEPEIHHVPVLLGDGRRLFDVTAVTGSSWSWSGASRAATRHTCATGSCASGSRGTWS
jgi:dihydrofolate reductase